MHDVTDAPIPDGHALPQSAPWDDLKQRSNYVSRAQVLEMSVRLAVRVPGNIVEFGVATGESTRTIRRTLRWHPMVWLAPHKRKKIFALDSFEGLPEKYENAQVGTFAGAVPKIRGVEFVKGYFETTCTEELRNRVGRVAFAHLDADLYSSTMCALRWMTPLLGTGSILQFDEFIGENQAESRAFTDWRAETGLKLTRIAEFEREPSGWGDKVDRRVIFQVIGDELLPVRPGMAFLKARTRFLGERTIPRLKKYVWDKL
jgi:hypothetical protein